MARTNLRILPQAACVAFAAAITTAASLSFISCSTIEVPRQTGAAPRDAKNAFAHSELDSVLQRFVDKSGRVDYGGLRLSHAGLDKYLGQIAQTSPENDKSLFPTPAHRAAYWINAYNACVLKQVIESNITDAVGDSIPSEQKFFKLTKFVAGGETMSLSAMQDLAHASGDARVFFLLCKGAMGSPRLRNSVITGEQYEKVAEEAAVEFCNEERNVTIGPRNADNPGGSVTLSKLFDDHAGEFVQYARGRGVANASIRDAVNLWRKKETRVPLNANDYFRPFDAALNRQLTGSDAK